MLNRLTLALAIVSTFSFSLFASSTAKSSLPLSAQSTISATLGADSQAYQAHSSKIEITAVNSAQDLSTRFTSRGIEVKSGNARWSLAFLGYGRGQILQAAQPAIP